MKTHTQANKPLVYTIVSGKKGEEFIGFIVFVVHKKCILFVLAQKKKYIEISPKHRGTGAMTLIVSNMHQTNTSLGTISRYSDSVV